MRKLECLKGRGRSGPQKVLHPAYNHIHSFEAGRHEHRRSTYVRILGGRAHAADAYIVLAICWDFKLT